MFTTKRKMTMMRMKVEMGTHHLMTMRAGIFLCYHPYQALLRSLVHLFVIRLIGRERREKIL
jgi:hypothetical protein